MADAILNVFRGGPDGGKELEYKVPIAPGMVITERQRRLWYPDEQQIAATRARQAIPDAVTADDIARMALFLASDESRRITRQCFVVDAGLT